MKIVGSLHTSRTGSPDQRGKYVRSGFQQQTAATCNKSNASSPNLSLCVANYPSLNQRLDNELLSPPVHASSDSCHSGRRTWADIAKSKSPNSTSPSRSNQSLVQAGDQNSANADGRSETQDSVPSNNPAQHEDFDFDEDNYAGDGEADIEDSDATETEPFAALGDNTCLTEASSVTDTTLVGAKDIGLPATAAPNADLFPSISEVDETTLGESPNASRFNFVIKPGEMNEGKSAPAVSDITFFYDPDEPPAMSPPPVDEITDDRFVEQHYDESYYDTTETDSGPVVRAVDGGLLFTADDGLQMLFKEAQQPSVDIAQLPARHAKMIHDNATLWRSFCREKS